MAYLDTLVFIDSQNQINDNTLYINDVPTAISGSERLTGVLVRQNHDLYLKVGDQDIPVKFIEAVGFRGNHFDQKSIGYYLNKKVNIIAEFDHGILYISAIVISNVFESINNLFPLDSNYKKLIEEDYVEFVTDTLMEDALSKNLEPFKATLFDDAKVKNGDHVLIISLSGRQGDDLVTVGGHFVLGEATVKHGQLENFSFYNFYTTKNKKLMMPTKVSYEDYFGHLSQGQQNYRPTYTLLVYGVDKDKIKKMTEVIGRDLEYMRTSGDTGGISYDCVNTALHALYKSEFIENPNFLGLESFYTPPKDYTEGKYSYFNNSWYYILNTKRVFLPRSGFEYVLENIETFNPKRVDFVFYNQTPSGRPVGGAPIAGVLKYFRISLHSNEISEQNTVYDIATFLDDSGNTGKKLDDELQPLFLLAGFIIDEKIWREVDGYINQVKKKYDVLDFEIHAIDVINGKKGTPYRNWDYAKKLDFFTEMLEVIRKFELNIIFFEVKKKNFKNYFQSKYGKGFEQQFNISPYLLAFSYILQIGDSYLIDNDSNGILILDEQDEWKKPANKTFNILRTIVGEPEVKIEKLLDRCFFVDSSESNMIQLADIVAYNLKRYLECDIKEFSDSKIKERKALYEVFKDYVYKPKFDYGQHPILEWLEKNIGNQCKG